MIVDVRTSKAVLERKMPSEVNEMAFPRRFPPASAAHRTTPEGDLDCAATFGSCLFMTGSTNQQGIIECFPFDTSTGTMAELPSRSIVAHTSSVYCVDFSPCGKFFATGSADSLSSVWDADELICIRTFDRLE
jgi:WD40 repeat protein